MRQVRDALEVTANNNDSQPMIEALLEDLCVSVGDGTTAIGSPTTATWHRRMISASKSTGLNTPAANDDFSLVEHHFSRMQSSYQQEQQNSSLSPTSSVSTIWPGSVGSNSVN